MASASQVAAATAHAATAASQSCAASRCSCTLLYPLDASCPWLLRVHLTAEVPLPPCPPCSGDGCRGNSPSLGLGAFHLEFELQPNRLYCEWLQTLSLSLSCWLQRRAEGHQLCNTDGATAVRVLVHKPAVLRSHHFTSSAAATALVSVKPDSLCPATCRSAAVFAVAPYNATTDSLPQLQFRLARLLESPPRKQTRRPARHANGA